MRNYVFVLKNEKTNNHFLINLILVFFNFMAFAFLLINDEKRIGQNLALLFAIVISGFYLFLVVINIILKKITPEIYHRVVFWLCATVWIKEGFWWLSILIFIFVLFEILSHRKLIIIVTDNKIILPSLFQKQVKWEDLNNFILKDELLTLDFKNNKLLQHLIQNEEEKVDEKEFNDFCKSRLK